MIAHQSGRWGCIASSSWNNGCTCLPCHLCLLIVSLSYIGEASASPASDRRAFIWKSHYFLRDCSFCCFFFFYALPFFSFLPPPVFIFLFQWGGQRWKLNECAGDTDFTSWLGEVTARGWKVHKHLFFTEEGPTWQTTLISSSFGAINRHASQSYLQLGGTGRTQTGSHEGVDKRL